MPNTLQAAGNKAFAKLPYWLTNGEVPTILPAPKGSDPKMIAGFEAGNAKSPLYVGNPSLFENADYTPQLEGHELSHRKLDNLPPLLKAKMPPINPADPYNYGGEAGLKKIGSDPLKMSEEEVPAAEQYIIAQRQGGHKLSPAYQKFENNFRALPQSVMEQTDPNQKGINTMARTPGLPAGYDMKTGKILQAQQVQPVPKGSGQSDPYASIAQAAGSDDPYASIATDAAPTAPTQPTDTRNGLQKMVDTAAEPDSAETRAKQTPVENALSAFGKGATQTLIQPLVHPVQTGKGLLHSFAHLSPYDPENPVAQIGKSAYGDFQKNGAAEAIPHLLGQGAGMFIGGELGGKIIPKIADGTALDAIPTRARAGRLFEDVMSKAADQPVTLSPGTMKPLERTQQLASAGGKPFGTADKLYQRINQTQPLSYSEARDFASNMSLSPEEKIGLKKSMRYEVPKLSASFNQDVGRAAQAAGKESEYQRAMSMYRRAARNRDLLKQGAKYVGIPATAGLAGKMLIDKLHPGN